MNRFAVLAVFIVTLVPMEVARGQDAEGCDRDAAQKCTTTYNSDSIGVKDDKSKFCTAVNTYKQCLMDAKCLDEERERKIENTLNEVGYTCGGRHCLFSHLMPHCRWPTR